MHAYVYSLFLEVMNENMVVLKFKSLPHCFLAMWSGYVITSHSHYSDNNGNLFQRILVRQYLIIEVKCLKMHTFTSISNFYA